MYSISTFFSFPRSFYNKHTVTATVRTAHLYLLFWTVHALAAADDGPAPAPLRALRVANLPHPSVHSPREPLRPPHPRRAHPHRRTDARHAT